MNSGNELRVFPTHVRDPECGFAGLFRSLARCDRFGVHQLCDDPESADIILFLDLNELAEDTTLKCLRNHSLLKRHRQKAFVYCEFDQPWCAVQGLYVSMPAGAFEPQRQMACGYIAQSLNGRINSEDAKAIHPDYLFSFVGRGGNPAREAVLKLKHPASLIADTTHLNFFAAPTPGLDSARQNYASTLYRSQFVLCPRGAGTSSYRLYEAMQAGRVPVIISDQWVAPVGPDWSTFSIRCRERDVCRLPQRLESIRENAEEMGKLARCAWDEWFASDVLFHRMVEACAYLMQQRRWPEWLAMNRPSLRYYRVRARDLKAKFRSVARKVSINAL